MNTGTFPQILLDYLQACTEAADAKINQDVKRKAVLERFSAIMRIYYSDRKEYKFWRNYITNYFSEDSDYLGIDKKFGMVVYSHYGIEDKRNDPTDIEIRLPVKLFGLSDGELADLALKKKERRERRVSEHSNRSSQEQAKDRERREYERYLELKKKYENKMV